jgi:beta-N-acetylhexosaminidase
VLSVAWTASPRRPTPKAATGKPVTLTVKASATVRRWMRGMTLRDEVAQLVFIAFHGESPNTRSPAYRKFLRLIHDTKVGGLVLTNVANGRVVQKAEPYALAAFINRMQRMAKTPLMVAADFERGASMRVEGTTPFPHAMAFGAAGDPALTRYEGEVTAREARALGVQWVFYPVADVNSNPDNPIINIRSFGENPVDVAKHVRAFIEGAHSDRKNLVLTTAKHFPGHGDTAVDTHMNLATITADRERLEQVELIPFRAAIEAGVDSIMTAHIAVPALSPPDLPATLSPAILTDLLRKNLGFTGLVVTDALEMGGVARGYSTGDACVRALEAGADTLLMPADPDAAIRAVVSAVESGRLSHQRIQTSVVKILSAKERAGLDRKRLVDLEAIGDVVDSPEANEKAQETADRAVTLFHSADNFLPLAAPDRACYVVLSENRYGSQGQAFLQEVRKRVKGVTTLTLDPSMPRTVIDDSLGKLTTCQSYVIAAFAQVGANRGSVGLLGELPHAVEAIAARGSNVALIALGSPYFLRNFPNLSAYIATFSTVPPSEIAAVKALFGEIAIHGRTPVTIPGMAKYGDGLQLAAKVTVTQ